MKYLFIFFTLIISMSLHQDIFAITYKQDITLSENPAQPNTQSNINRAKLVQVHIGNFINNIENTSKKYWLENQKTITDSLTVTTVMMEKIQQIQTLKIEKDIAGWVLTTIVEDLKSLNTVIKQYFHDEIDSINNYHKRYWVAADKIAAQLDRLTTKLKIKIKSKSALSARDKQVLRHVFKLEKHSQNLKNYSNIEFYKKDEVRASLIRIIRDIKKEIQKLRDL